MAKYSDIKGFTVQTLSTDTVASQAALGSWASGGNLNTGRNGVRGAGVSQTATVVFGGNDGSVTGKTENYNGSSWTETTDMNTGKTNSVGTGTYTAAIAAYTSTSEIWDGSSWTEVSEMNTPRQEVGSLGTSTAALAMGNQNGASAIVEQWDGSSWTEVNDLNTAVGACTGFGTTSAGHAVGGGDGSSPPQIQAINQIWNGSSFSEGADMNTARYFSAASGTTTAGLVFSGYSTTQVAITESWDGTAFTEQADLSTARFTGAPAHNSTQADAILAGGNPSNKNNTEEWTAPSVFSKITEGQLYFNSTTNTFKETITDVAGASWAAGGNMVEGRYGNSGFGNNSNAITAGGQPPAFSGSSSKTEQYNGSAWSEVNDLNTDHFFAGALGSSYTAGIVMGGQTPPGTRIAITESWNGTNWTEVNDLNTARSSGTLSATGTSTAGIYAGGRTSPGSPGGVQSVNESWDGTSWTELNDLNTARYTAGSGGTQTSALQFGGYNGTAVVDLVESWDGTSWTEVTDLNTQRTALGGTGSSNTSALAYGGLNPPGRQNETEFWNGTSWTELNNLSTARQDFGSSSALSITNVIASGGETGPAVSAATEEWTVNLANKTITAS
jgi:hypothetical protein